MIPLRDDNPSRTVPFITRGFIFLNVLAFVYELTLTDGTHEFIREWGVVPGRLFAALTGPTSLPLELLTLLTSMFLHGGWLHLIGNLWYLWIFGDNVEDRMGHARFFLFYIGAGVCSALVHSALMPGSPVPTVGASGAIAGVLGAYAYAFPRARVLTLVPIFFFFQIIAIPALILLGIWFAYQFIAGTMSFGMASGSGGVAWWAHIAGFVFGFIAMMAVARKPGSRAELVD
jgi:membrane associated rhomboid family serine protease